MLCWYTARCCAVPRLMRGAVLMRGAWVRRAEQVARLVHSERPAGGWGGDGCSAGAPTTTAAAAAAAAGLSAAGETATGEIAGELQWGY